MKLVKGQQVPDFKWVALEGDTFSRDSMLGKRYMISFYRYASCPFCNLRISFLMALHETLNLNNQMLAVFQSDEKDMRKHVADQKPSFPLISDHKRIDYKKFGVEKSVWAYIRGAMRLSTLFGAFKKGFLIRNSMGPKTTVPADFLVDEKGIIQYAYYGKDISDHLDIDIVEVFLSAQ